MLGQSITVSLGGSQLATTCILQSSSGLGNHSSVELRLISLIINLIKRLRLQPHLHHESVDELWIIGGEDVVRLMVCEE